MKIIKPSYIIMTTEAELCDILTDIASVARVCYKSENISSMYTDRVLVQNLIKNGHDAMLEHRSLSVKFICDRGISHELVRHRMASFAQESTRYCNYSKDKFGKEITVIEPCFWDKHSAHYGEWEIACRQAEKAYFALLSNGSSPQEARSVLPNSLKTELVITANLREWRHLLRLRTQSNCHPQMLELTRPLLHELQTHLPVIFGDIAY